MKNQILITAFLAAFWACSSSEQQQLQEQVNGNNYQADNEFSNELENSGNEQGNNYQGENYNNQGNNYNNQGNDQAQYNNYNQQGNEAQNNNVGEDYENQSNNLGQSDNYANQTNNLGQGNNYGAEQNSLAQGNYNYGNENDALVDEELGEGDQLANVEGVGEQNFLSNNGIQQAEQQTVVNAQANTPNETVNLTSPVEVANAFSDPIANNAAPAQPATVPLQEQSLDAAPRLSRLQWVGYDYTEKSVTVEMRTADDAKFELYQEYNQRQQPELVVRFLDTFARDRMKRAVVADEFRSPVAHVRTRQNPYENYTDVLVTLRDAVRPRLYASGRDIKLTYAVPNRYWGRNPVAVLPYSKAQLMDSNITPENYEQPQVAPAVPEVPVQNTAPVVNNAEPGNADQLNTVNVEDLPNTNQVENSFDAEGLPVNDFENNLAQNVNQSQNPVILQGQNVQSNNNFNFANPANQNVQPANNAVVNELPNQEQQFDQVFNQSQLNPVENNLANPQQSQGNYNNEQYNNQQQGNSQQYNNQQYNNQQQYNNNNNGQQYNNQQQYNNDLDFENDQNFDGEQDGGDDIEKFEVREESFFSVGAVAQAELFEEDETDFQNAVDTTQDEFGQDIVGTDIRQLQANFGSSKVNLDFRGAPLSEVIRAIANESGINFTMPPTLGNTAVYISLKQVPWDQALKAVLETNGLAMVKIAPGLLRVDRLNVLANEVRQIRTTQETAEALVPTKVMIIRLSYAQAGTVSGLITNLLNETGDAAINNLRIQVDQRTNSLLIEGTPKQLAKAKALVDRVDLRTPQVEIISRIVEVQNTDNDIFGISWNTVANFDANNGLGFGGLTFPNYARSQFTIDPGVPSSSVGRIGVRMGSINSAIDLTSIIAFEETRARLELHQSNRVVVQDNQAATISGGSTDFFVAQSQGTTIVTGGGDQASSNVSQVNFDVSLQVTPQISVDGTIDMQVNISSSTPRTSASPDAQTASTNRNITTRFRNKSGDTAVIGGLWDTFKQRNTAGIPFLSSLPIIGHLFKSTTKNDVKRELLIMLTPRILDAGGVAGSRASSSFSFNNAAGNTDNANSGDESFEYNNSQSNNVYNNTGANGFNTQNGSLQYQQGQSPDNQVQYQQQNQGEFTQQAPANQQYNNAASQQQYNNANGQAEYQNQQGNANQAEYQNQQGNANQAEYQNQQGNANQAQYQEGQQQYNNSQNYNEGNEY